MGHSVTMAALRQKIDDSKKARGDRRSSRADAVSAIRQRVKGRLKEAAERRAGRRTASGEERSRRRAHRVARLRERLEGWARRRVEKPLAKDSG